MYKRTPYQSTVLGDWWNNPSDLAADIQAGAEGVAHAIETGAADVQAIARKAKEVARQAEIYAAKIAGAVRGAEAGAATGWQFPALANWQVLGLLGAGVLVAVNAFGKKRSRRR